MQSEQIEKIAVALTKVQANLNPATPSATNPAFGKSRKYATLDDVWDAVRHPLALNDLSVAQGVDRDATGPFLWTLLMHSSGQWIRAEMPLILGKQDPQGVGAAMTYYRRYSLAAMVGVTQDDDDAQSAMPGKATANKSGSPYIAHKKAMESAATMNDLAVAFEKAKADKDKMTAKEFIDLAGYKDVRKSELTPIAGA